MPAYNANQDFPNVVQNIALPVGVDGQTWVTEAYAEFAIPVLKDLPGVKLLEIDPGVRYSNYNSAAGDVLTFKIMGTLEVVDEVRFRGGYQRANRAPNVAELFTPRGVGSEFGVGPDPCRNTPSVTPTWGNTSTNPNRINMQIALPVPDDARWGAGKPVCAWTGERQQLQLQRVRRHLSHSPST